MQPYYQDSAVTIYHGDCREILPTLEPVDAVITDPPYCIDFSQADWSDSPADYLDLTRWLVGESNRLTNNGPCFVWQALPTLSKWHLCFPDGFRVLANCKGFVRYRPTPVQWSWDPVIFWNVSGPGSVFRKDWFVQRKAPFGAHRERVAHPCPKPPESVRYVVSLTEALTILDPFMGSGTTLRAAKDLNRKAIGIEIEEKYCEIAAKRMAQEVLQFR